MMPDSKGGSVLDLFDFKTTDESFLIRYVVTESPDMKDFYIHSHDAYELLYLQSGRMICYIEGNTYELNSGDMIMTNMRELHKSIPDRNVRYERKYLRFKPSFVLGLQMQGYHILSGLENRKLGFNNKILEKDVRAYGLDTDMEQIYRYAQFGQPDDLLLIRVTLIKMLVSINRIMTANKHLNTSTIGIDENTKAILEYINNNLAGNLTLNRLEEEFHLSRSHLSRRFKEKTGFNISEYVVYKRIMKAKEMLADEDLSAQEVAHAVGYSDYSAFYRAFRRIVGVPPSNLKGK